MPRRIKNNFNYGLIVIHFFFIESNDAQDTAVWKKAGTRKDLRRFMPVEDSNLNLY